MEKKVKVNSWLEKVYGKVPPYQDTPECLDHLEKIMELSEQEEHGMELISQLQIHQMAEYKEETDRIKQRFDILGLNANPNSNHSELDNIINFLSNISESLGLDDPNENEMNLAISDVRHYASKLPVDTYMTQTQYNNTKCELINDVKLLNKSERELVNSRTEAKMDEENISNYRKKYSFLQGKERQYLKDQDKYVTTIRKNGFEKAHSHESIVSQKKKLDDIEERIKPIKSKLDGYKGLPPSLDLAQAEMAEKENTLLKLKLELQKEVENIRF